MADSDRRAASAPGWLHAWTVLTACLTVPLVFLGAEVTTNQIGMVDPAWPTAPWHLVGVSWIDHGIGYLIEHWHRVIGWTVGFLALGQAGLLWQLEPRAWVRKLGLAAVLAVGIQGLLGGFRVRLHALAGPDLAMIHGIFGQLTFSLLASLAVFTSPRWSRSAPLPAADDAQPIRRWSLVLTALLLLQLVLGAITRHRGDPLVQRLHLFTAFAVVSAISWLVGLTWHSTDRRLAWLARGMGLLAVVQVGLGIEAWIIKLNAGLEGPAAPGHWLLRADLLRTAHVVVGALILVCSVAATLETQRLALVLPEPESEPASQMEGAA